MAGYLVHLKSLYCHLQGNGAKPANKIVIKKIALNQMYILLPYQMNRAQTC